VLGVVRPAASRGERDGRWTEALAMGRERFVTDAKRELGMRGVYRSVELDKDGYVLREPAQNRAYNASFRL
jgi:hypothetical protein